jgi:hypothetical protein
VCRSTPVAATKSFLTCSASPFRSSPWSTKRRSAGTRWRAAPARRPPRSRRRPTARRWPSPADLLGDPGDLLVDDALHGPVRPAPRRPEEPPQHLHAMFGVQYLGMELDTVKPRPGPPPPPPASPRYAR